MQNTTQLRKELATVFSSLKSKKLDRKIGQTMVRVSNSMLKSAALELEQNKFLGKKKEIKFLNTPRS